MQTKLDLFICVQLHEIVLTELKSLVIGFMGSF